MVDPGQEAVEPLEELLAEHRLTPVAVLLTHGHFDHTFSVAPVCDGHDVPAFIHPDDRAMLADPLKGMSRDALAFFGGRLEMREPREVRTLDDGAQLELAGLALRVDHTPGHTPGSIVFGTATDEGVEVILAGDTLFAGSIGRTDLPGRRHRADDAQPARQAADPRRRHLRAARARPGHDDRAGAGVEPVPAGSRRCRRRGAGCDRRDRPTQPAEPSFAAPKGVPEYFPPESAGFEHVRNTLQTAADRAGYGLIELPVFEDTGLYARGVGESTDVVSKEMYTFADRGDRSVTLRPEGTAGVVRAVIEHGLDRGRAAGEAALRGPVLPLRAPAGGPLPAAAAGRGRGDRRGRPRAGRRGDRGRGRGLPGPRAHGVPAGADLARRRRLPPGLRRAAARLPRRARPRRGHPAPRAAQPAAGARRQASRGPRPASPTRRCWSTTSRRRRPRTTPR